MDFLKFQRNYISALDESPVRFLELIRELLSRSRLYSEESGVVGPMGTGFAFDSSGALVFDEPR